MMKKTTFISLTPGGALNVFASGYMIASMMNARDLLWVAIMSGFAAFNIVVALTDARESIADGTWTKKKSGLLFRRVEE